MIRDHKSPDGEAATGSPRVVGTSRAAAARGRKEDAPARDLVTAIRAELAAIEPARGCCRAAERAGLGTAAHGRAPSPAVGRLAVRLESAVPATAGPLKAAAFDWTPSTTHCRLAFLRGLFLARGSLSLAHGRTHLEFVVPLGDAQPLAERLAAIGLPASVRERRGRSVLTWKSATSVTTFLRLIGGTAATLELESRFVTRSLRGHLNRAINAETANLLRSVATAGRQLAAIDALAAAGELERLPAAVRHVAELRRREPAATFSDIAERLGISRAIVQRSFEALESRALHLGLDDSARDDEATAGLQFVGRVSPR